MSFYKKSSGNITSTVFAGLVMIFIIAGNNATAQKRKLLGGSLDGLKEQTSYDLKFTYDSMMIGEVVPEKQYLAEKKRDWEVKEPGKGYVFVDQWFNVREARYEPTFIKNFEKYANVKLNDKNAKYALIVKTKRTEGGWNLGITSHPGEIDGEMWVVESADHSKVIAKIGFYDFRGKISTGGDFEMTNRINSAYELAGKGLGDFIKRKSK